MERKIAGHKRRIPSLTSMYGATQFDDIDWLVIPAICSCPSVLCQFRHLIFFFVNFLSDIQKLLVMYCCPLLSLPILDHSLLISEMYVY